MNIDDIYIITEAITEIFADPFQNIWKEFDNISQEIQNVKLWFSFFFVATIIFILLATAIIILLFLKLEKEIKQAHRDNLVLQEKIITFISDDSNKVLESEATSNE